VFKVFKVLLVPLDLQVLKVPLALLARPARPVLRDSPVLQVRLV
jgi:hypothetical protein